MTSKRCDRSPRRVLLLGATFETSNMGVGALASGAITLLSTRFPGAEISFLDYGRQPTVSQIEVEGGPVRVPLVNLRFSWKIFLRNNVIYLLMLALLSRLLGQGFTQRIAAGNRWIKAIRDADLALAVSGGDSFSDIYGLGRFFYVYLPQALVIALGTRLVILPQTVGPFRTSLARNLAGHLVRRAELIYSRDRTGIRDIQDMLGPDGSPARFCYDMGFILEPRRPADEALAELTAFRLSGRTLVGLNVSGLLLMGGYDRDNAFELKIDYQTFIEDAIAFLIDHKNADVVLVPHVFGTQPESDTHACNSIYDALKDRYPGRLACLRGNFDQNEIKYAIGQCDFFIGARMHACIAALSQAIPAIGVAYSRKFLGVFETVGAAPLVADPRQLSIEEILAVIDDAMNRREEIAAGLRRTMVVVRRDVFAAMDGVA
jgi:colanic acid/amylovoran biosynthesis protein